MQLMQKGIVEQCCDEDVVEEVGIFFVKKKSGDLRLIFDTRRSNCKFEAPPYTGLPSAEGLADLEAGVDHPLIFGAGDVEVCFYQYALPLALRGYFGLPAVKAKFLPGGFRRDLGCSTKEESVRFRCRVIPMGWSWAVCWVQSIHLEVFRRAGICGPWMRDKLPLESIEEGQFVSALYIDNFAAFGYDKEVVRDARDEMRKALGAAGIVTYLDGDLGDEGDFLGFSLKEGRRWELTSRKFWKIVLGLRWIL
jgi:hypothetical protein